MQAPWRKDGNGQPRAVWLSFKQLKIARLIFVGQPAIPLSLQEQIAKSLSTRDYVDDAEGKDDLTERIRDAWQHQGYFMAKVDFSGSQVLEETAETRTVALTVRIDAGKQYRLDNIEFQIAIFDPARRSLSSLPSAEQHKQFSAEELRAFFPIEQGETFDTHRIQQGLEALRRAYGMKGFINMTVVPTMLTDEKTDRITLTLEIEEGKQFRIGNIEVLGLDPSASRQLLQNYGVIRGNVFDARRISELLRDSVVLPDGYSPEDYIERRMGREATVDLILRAPCSDR
jgi:outer membrane protein assembly factor BamA